MSKKGGKPNKKRYKVASPLLDRNFRNREGELILDVAVEALNKEGLNLAAAFFKLDGASLLLNLAALLAKYNNAWYARLKHPLTQWIGDNSPSSFYVMEKREDSRFHGVLYVRTRVGVISVHVRNLEVENNHINPTRFRKVENFPWRGFDHQRHAVELLKWYLRFENKSEDQEKAQEEFERWKKQLSREARRFRLSLVG